MIVAVIASAVEIKNRSRLKKNMVVYIQEQHTGYDRMWLKNSRSYNGYDGTTE